MALWVCLFEDDDRMLAVREARRAEHHAYLEAHRREIVMAGALMPSEGQPPAGAAWILNAETRADAEALVTNDPYYKSGYRKYRMFLWKFARQSDYVTLLPLLLAQGVKAE